MALAALEAFLLHERTLLAYFGPLSKSIDRCLVKLGNTSFYISFSSVMQARQDAVRVATSVASFPLDETTVRQLTTAMFGVCQQINSFLPQAAIALYQSCVAYSRDQVFASAVDDIGLPLTSFQALMTLPAADFGNYSRLSATVAVQFPSSAATDVQTRETASRIAGLEKLMTLEFHCKLKPQPDDDDLTTTLRKLPACLILDAAGLRTFVREGNLLKVTKSGGSKRYLFWLFSDALMYGKETESASYARGFHVHKRFLLARLKLEIPRDVGGSGLFLRDTTTDRRVQFVFTSKEDRDAFRRELTKLITAQHALASGVMVSSSAPLVPVSSEGVGTIPEPSPSFSSESTTRSSAGSIDASPPKPGTETRVSIVRLPSVRPPEPPPLPPPPPLVDETTPERNDPCFDGLESPKRIPQFIPPPPVKPPPPPSGDEPVTVPS